MWQMKTWKLNERDKMEEWCRKNEHRYQIEEVFVSNEWAVEYRKLKVIM